MGETKGETKKENWRELCAEAANEPDPERLASLVDRIIQVMDEARQRITGDRPSGLAS